MTRKRPDGEQRLVMLIIFSAICGGIVAMTTLIVWAIHEIGRLIHGQ